MKALASGSPGAGHINYLPKLRQKRTRTCSSDSGCDVLCDSPDLSTTVMEDAIHTWEIRLDGVVKQEVERGREVTSWAKEALRHSAEGTVTLIQKNDLDCFYLSSLISVFRCHRWGKKKGSLGELAKST